MLLLGSECGIYCLALYERQHLVVKVVKIETEKISKKQK